MKVNVTSVNQLQPPKFGMQEYIPPENQLQKRSKSREQTSHNTMQLQTKTLYKAPLRKTFMHKSSTNLMTNFNFRKQSDQNNSSLALNGLYNNGNAQKNNSYEQENEETNNVQKERGLSNLNLEQYLLKQRNGIQTSTHLNTYQKNLQKTSSQLIDSLKINQRSQSNTNLLDQKKQMFTTKRKTAALKPFNGGQTTLQTNKHFAKEYLNPVFANEEKQTQLEDQDYSQHMDSQQNKQKQSLQQQQEQNDKNQKQQDTQQENKKVHHEFIVKTIKKDHKLPKLGGSEKHPGINEARLSIINESLSPNSNFLKGKANDQPASTTHKNGINKNFVYHNHHFSDKELVDIDGEENEKKMSHGSSISHNNLDTLKVRLNKKTAELNFMGNNYSSPFNNNNLQSNLNSTTNHSQQGLNYKGLYSSQNKRTTNQVQPKTRSFTPGQIQKKHLMEINKKNYKLEDENNDDQSYEEHARNNIKKKQVQEEQIGNDQKINFIQTFAQVSRAGSNLQGPKTNQDSFIIKKNLNSKPDRYIFAVCDGHGQNGHLVSAFLKNNLPKKIEANLEKDLESKDEEFIRNCLSLAFLQTSQALLSSNIDCTFSGSTCVLVLIIEDQIWTANVGDSRAVIGRGKGFTNYKAVPLSHDHKVDSPEELKRILDKGGRAEPYRDYEGNQLGPYRVWLKNEDIPGLAMARSFGDIVATQAGVICEPQILKYDMTEEDRFLIVCSDGVWEFIENQQALNLVLPFYIKYQPEQACQKLVKDSVVYWKKNDEVIDDITAVVVFFKRPNRNQNSNISNNHHQSLKKLPNHE